MKVYIITSGEYECYGIEKIFLNKEKAEEYKRLYTNNYIGEAVNIEEYDTSDKGFEIGKYKIVKYLNIDYKTDGTDEIFNISIRMDNTHNCDNLNGFPYQCKSYNHYIWSEEEDELNMHIPVDDNFEITQEIEDKYLKVCRDYIAKAKSLYELEGYTWDEVERMLSDEEDNI